MGFGAPKTWEHIVDGFTAGKTLERILGHPKQSIGVLLDVSEFIIRFV